MASLGQLVTTTLLCVVSLMCSLAAGVGPAAGGTAASRIPVCTLADYDYMYTECDEDNNRWRVAVPSKECTGGTVPAPTRAAECGKTCAPGQYLDMDKTLDCVKCTSGTYSLGGGERFDNWDKLPPGFNVDVDDGSMWGEDDLNCTGSYWKAVGPFVVSPGDYCYSKLTYSAELKKEGSLNFTYSLASSDTLFHVEVRNEQCETIEYQGRADKFPEATGENQWSTIEIPLEAGHNIISWRAVGLSSYSSKRPARVLINEIIVMGLDFTSKCTPCPPGTYTPDAGHSQCIPCAENTISTGGNSECTPCADNEYALRGSSTCTVRKKCTDSDYYKHYDYSKCHESPHQTTVKYFWIEPTICVFGIEGAAGRPQDGHEDCPNCNPGMQLTDDGSCQFCGHGKFSDGKEPCKKCPPLTRPKEMMKFFTWKEIPPVMRTICLSNEKDDTNCGKGEGWVPAGDHIHSGENYPDDVYLILTLDTEFQIAEGGYFEGQATPIAELAFAFTLECNAACSLYFVEELENDDPQIIKTWIGATSEAQVYKHKIMTATSRKFSWAFEKKDPEKEVDEGLDLRHDVARMYNITVTNVKNGGAGYCEPCPEGKNKECITCSDGMYFSNETKKCIPCKLNTYLSANKDECIPCGPGLKNVQEKVCYSDCTFTLDDIHYDLSALKGFHILDTSSSFTEQGNRYFKRYNISLCGTSGRLDTMCTSNRRSYATDVDETINSLICRSTILPTSGDSNDPQISTQIMSIGDVLLGISHENTLHGMIDNITKPRTDGLDVKDIRFFYHSPHITSGCPQGRSTVITLRCDPNEKDNGTMAFIPECRDGTCDGCNFLILWTTEMACPSCTSKEYMEIPGECIDGNQEVTYVWKEDKICVGGATLPKKRSQECEMPVWYKQMPWYAQWSIAGMVTLALLMLVLIVFFWKRNRKLEYKYEKLIASANGELPAAETCALSEGEDEDDVVFQDGKKRNKFFNKFRFKNGSGEKGGLLEENDEAFTASSHIMEPMHLSNI